MKQQGRSTHQCISLTSPHPLNHKLPFSPHGKSRYHYYTYILIRTLSVLLLVFSVLLNVYDFFMLVVLRPTMLQLSLQKASLAEFNLRHRRILSYNLTLDVTMKNPNKRSGLFYERLQAMAFYGEEQFAEVALPCFYQAPLNVSMLQPSFAGRSIMNNSYAVASDFILQRAQGWFHFDIKVLVEVRLKLGPVNASRYRAVLSCGLVVPLASANSTQEVKFNWTTCVAGFPSWDFVPQVMRSSSYYNLPLMLSFFSFLVLVALHFV